MTDEEQCCADNWAVWLHFETPIWAVLLLLQISMVVFLLLHGRKEKAFRQAFYAFFIAVTVVDCALVLLRPLRDAEETTFGTHYDFPYTTAEVNGTTVYNPTVRARINDMTMYVLVPVFAHAQPLFLTAIAANRFTAFCFPLRHASVWRRRAVISVMVALATISVLFGTAYPVAKAINQAVKCSKATAQQRELLQCDVWPFTPLVPLALVTFNSAICCLVSFALNVGSVTMLVMLRVHGKLQQKGPELRLFIHSLYTFILQMMLAFQDVVFVADSADFISEDLGIRGFSWDRFRHSSEWLAGLKATRKCVDGSCWIVPGCRTSKRAWTSERRPLPTCSVWYRFATGELRLREDPAFTVRTLVLCLLALSGSIFLLIISGNVRNAFLGFYFRCTSSPQETEATYRHFRESSDGQASASESCAKFPVLICRLVVHKADDEMKV